MSRFRREGRTHRDGSMSAALAYPSFRVVWLASFGSNIGSWMQNVALGAFAFRLTGSSAFGAQLGLAQMAPQLVFASVGGVLADSRDRVRVMQATQIGTMLMCAFLTFEVRAADPSRTLLLATAVGLGICNSLNGPVFNSLLPNLVERRDLGGVIALMSTQMNLARVVGPAIGGLLTPRIDVWGVFAINTGSFLLLIIVLFLLRIPPSARRAVQSGVVVALRSRLLGGFSVVRRDVLVRRLMITMSLFSLFSLSFLTLMPMIGTRNLAMNTKTLAYGLLYAAFGFGAAGGAIVVGTVFAGKETVRFAPAGFAIFAVMLAVFGSTHSRPVAYAIAPLLGLAYFGTVTCLSTCLQLHLDDAVRGRVMAVWMMAFGGLIPFGSLLGAWVADHRSVSLTTSIGAAVTLGLALLAHRWWGRGRPLTPARPARSSASGAKASALQAGAVQRDA